MMAASNLTPDGVLPTPRTRLIGRDHDLAAARAALLDTAVPLLTLTGPGGVGKTRLALAIAHDVAASFADGVVWIDLAPLSDPALVPSAVVSALDPSPRTDERVTDHLERLLRSRQALLLLDNCEHLLEGTAVLVALLLARCPAVQVLATSRSPLRIRGEHLLSVEPLSVPEGLVPLPLEEFGIFSAVALLRERACAVRPAFTLTPSNAPFMGEICRQLDGLPLAIELAAVHLRSLPPETLLAQMTDRLELLQHGPRDLPQRQRTLHETISWSYDLLRQDDQWLFRQLAVFVGGWTIDAAAGVSGWTTREALQGLEHLRDQSLIREMPGPQAPRFTMLETIREFGQARLAACGEAPDAQHRHAMFFLGLVERLDAHIFEHLSEATQVLAILQTEYPNLRTALAHFTDMQLVEPLAKLAGILHAFWLNQGLLREGERWLELAVGLGVDCPLPIRVWAQVGLAGMLYHQYGASDRTGGLLDEAVVLARASGDMLAIGLATEWRGALAHVTGDLELADSCHIESHAAFRALPERPWIRRNLSLIEARFAWIAFARGDLDTAEEISVAALERMRALDDAHNAPYLYAGDALTMLAYVARMRGELAAALMHFQEVLRIGAQASDQTFVLYSFIRLAETLDACGRQADAARLLGAAETLCERIGMPLRMALASAQVTGDRANSPLRDEIANVLSRNESEAWSRVTLADPLLANQWAEGRRMATATAIAEAVAIDPAQPPLLLAIPTATTPTPYDLTPREREILALLCERWTDPEIAERLFISRRTVSSHVAHLFVKLGVNSRRAAAALAVREALV